MKEKSGLKSHIDDFEEYLFGENKEKFREQLEIDIRNIVSDKKALGIIDFALPSDFSIDDSKIDFMFVFEPTADCSKEQYDLIYKQEIAKTRNCKNKLKKEYQTIFISPNNFKL